MKHTLVYINMNCKICGNNLTIKTMNEECEIGNIVRLIANGDL